MVSNAQPITANNRPTKEQVKASRERAQANLAWARAFSAHLKRETARLIAEREQDGPREDNAPLIG